MDINPSDIVKVNELAKSLQKHNLAATAEDALAQAEGITGAPRSFDVKEEVKEVEAVKEVRADDNVERNMRALTGAINQLNSKLTAAVQDIATLKQRVDTLSQKLEQIRSAPAAVPEPAPERQASLEEAQEDEPAFDVSVDKVFYSGKK